MPIRSPRQVYKIEAITVNIDEDQEGPDVGPAGTVSGQKRPIVAKIKESIAEYLGLSPIEFDDPIWTGTFQAGGYNVGAKFRKNLGGFREASYTLVAHNSFSIKERIKQENGSYSIRTKEFKTISIGFPRGHTVTEIVAWLKTLNNFSKVAAVVTPQGRRVPLSKDSKP